MTQTVAPTPVPVQEPLSQRTARRLRGAMAENRIRQASLAQASGIPQQRLSRKLIGVTPFTLDEVQRVAQALGIPVAAVLGTGDYEDRSIGVCASRDLNPEPADSLPPGVVIPHQRRGPPDTLPHPSSRQTRHLVSVPAEASA